MSVFSGYDLIGDIHGYAGILGNVLHKLGYRSREGCLRHPSRKAIFAGDILNKGPGSFDAFRIVSSMVEHGAADCVVGNHEWHFQIGLNLVDKALIPGDLLQRAKAHTEELLEDSGLSGQEKEEISDWILGLPLWIETPEIRVVHALWSERDMKILLRATGMKDRGIPLVRDLVANRVPYQGPLYRILNGVEWQFEPVPDTETGKDKESPETVILQRMRWWDPFDPEDPGQMAVKSTMQPGILKDPERYKSLYPGYPMVEKPVFFGHYCMDGEPGLLRNNACCLDWCIYRQNRLGVYRWSGEEALNPEHFLVFSS